MVKAILKSGRLKQPSNMDKPEEINAQYHKAKMLLNKSNKRAIGSSQIEEAEKDRDKLRKARAKKAVQCLTKNLPKADFNPNWERTALLRAIAKKAFYSAIENKVVFVGEKNNVLKAIFEGGSVVIESEDLEAQARLLFDWSKVSFKLKGKNGNPANALVLMNFLLMEAHSYSREMGKKKYASDYLSILTEKAIKEGELFDTTKMHDETKKEFANYIVGLANDLQIQFYRDRKRNLLLNCADVRFGLKVLTEKEALPYFEKMLAKGPIGGRKLGKNAPLELMTRFTNLMPLIK